MSDKLFYLLVGAVGLVKGGFDLIVNFLSPSWQGLSVGIGDIVAAALIEVLALIHNNTLQKR